MIGTAAAPYVTADPAAEVDSAAVLTLNWFGHDPVERWAIFRNEDGQQTQIATCDTNIFTLEHLDPRYRYRLGIKAMEGDRFISPVSNWVRVTPSDFAATPDSPIVLPHTSLLVDSWPNPFNGSTQIRVRMPVAGRLEVTLYDLLGRRVAVLGRGHYAPGDHEITFDGSRLASGVYLIHVEGPQGAEVTRRLVLIK